ncbi:MAG: spermidine synthase [Haloarculaceae archaeon]
MTDRRVTLALTFVVAFCSIAYELVYSEFLTVFYGGTVLRYSVTIGLYLFSLGVGALLSEHLDDPADSFLRTEVYLAFAGPAGAGFIVALNSFPDVVFPGKAAVTLALAHVPILVVGVLSGFEIPLLNDLVADRDRTVFAALGRAYPRTVVRRVLGVFFDVSEAEGRSFSEVLGVDYLGSLAGTVVYALVLYPTYGLVVTVLVLGLLNGLAALTFGAWVLWGRRRFDAGASDTDAADSGTGGAATPGTAEPDPVEADGGAPGGGSPSLARWRAVLLAGLLLTGAYAGLVANAGAVDRAVTGSYMGDRIESDYRPGRADVTVTSFERTRYQRVTFYERDVTGHEGTEDCFRLDQAVQLCDSWVRSYHSGLVDVPMSAFENTSSVDVLLVGGGDYIAVDHLRRYDVSVDQVDIDGEFLRMSRTREYLTQFNDGAWTYDRLNTTVGDAFTYLRHSDERYDLILLDIPGARSDDSLSLYSREFYTLLRRHLTDRGVVATWTYSPYFFGEHHKAYVNTVLAAGFDRHLSYQAYGDPDGDGELEGGERFYLLSDDATPTPDLSRARSPYLNATAAQYDGWTWQEFPHYRGVEPNSVFDPNYDVIVDP